MPRKPRIFSKLGIYHVMLKGNNDAVVFDGSVEVDKFLSLLTELKIKHKINIFAYCFMKNHMHLLLKVKKPRQISKIMKSLEQRYTYWYQRRHGRSGNIFKGRFTSKEIENMTYFKNVFRYIHLNPVKAGICSDPIDYVDSSYRWYFGDDAGLIDRDFVFEQVNQVLFAEFHSDNRGEDAATELGLFLKYSDRRPSSMTDEDAEHEMRRLSKCRDHADFHRLPRLEKWKFIKLFRQKHITFRQIAAFLAQSKGAVYYWNNMLDAALPLRSKQGKPAPGSKSSVQQCAA